MIAHLEAEITAFAVDAGVSNLKFTTNPTVGDDLDICADLDIDGDIIGAIYTITGTFADPLEGGLGGGSVGMDHGIVVPEGTIDIISSADAGVGGALAKFEIWYMPLDDGATIVAA